MAKSFSFNGTDLSSYGLRLKSHNLHEFGQETESYQLADKAHGGSSIRPPREILITAAIKAADFSTLCSYLDSIKSILNLKADAALTVDSITDRYWMARFGNIKRSDSGATYWVGELAFTAFDPAAFDNSETTVTQTII